MHRLSLAELIQGLRKKTFSSRELTEHSLKRIEQYKSLNAFISVDEEGALRVADSADQLLKNGQAKALTGIPMAHKDIFCTQSLPTTCGSKMLEHFYSPYEATLVKQLALQGAVVVGKTNMDEFAMGSANENSYFGPVKNPWNIAHVPGGSSGGSAAAVAAGLVAFTTGTDTGGSIRQPAAFCGISGLKPTYGLVSRFGMIAFASSLDVAGPMATTANDLALILQAMAGFDAKDSTSVNHPLVDYSASLNQSIKGLRIGLPSCFFQKEVDTDIQVAIGEAVKIFQQGGAEIVELDLSLLPHWVPCYYVIASAEASSNLSRYDGVRFGYRSEKGNSFREQIINTRSEGFGIEVKRRIMTGTHVLSSGFFDDYYLQALKVRRLIQNELENCFSKVDLIMGPTTPSCAFKLGEKVADPIQNYLADVFTVAANLAGLPAISIPAGFSKGLPIGLQLIARPFQETELFKSASYFQRSTDWHQASTTYKR
ncbi:MAG: Asp-tRNA(Asn)/Glu-tRNA(Gln) amidotransferase subunit GatA [Tatlockia sp.]|nr:Asp-tRNA(Asn)/Glu-tRNA(Gln) amidotransferase subunit GatA [Tatlockia sp.]